jgi:hypothetical protein
MPPPRGHRTQIYWVPSQVNEGANTFDRALVRRRALQNFRDFEQSEDMSIFEFLIPYRWLYDRVVKLGGPTMLPIDLALDFRLKLHPKRHKKFNYDMHVYGLMGDCAPDTLEAVCNLASRWESELESQSYVNRSTWVHTESVSVQAGERRDVVPGVNTAVDPCKKIVGRRKTHMNHANKVTDGVGTSVHAVTGGQTQGGHRAGLKTGNCVCFVCGYTGHRAGEI